MLECVCPVQSWNTSELGAMCTYRESPRLKEAAVQVGKEEGETELSFEGDLSPSNIS